jgi:hypothetical protein
MLVLSVLASSKKDNLKVKLADFLGWLNLSICPEVLSP